MAALKEKTFNGWPKSARAVKPKPAFSTTRDGLAFAAFDFASQEHVPLRLYTLRREGLDNAELIVLNVLHEASWPKWLAEMSAGFGEELKESHLYELRAAYMNTMSVPVAGIPAWTGLVRSDPVSIERLR